MTTGELASLFATCELLVPTWPPLSVCLARSGNDQWDVGICIRTGERNQVLHLAWHNQLVREELSPQAWFGCMRTRIPEARQRQVIARAALVYESNGRFVPYGFSFPAEAFDPETGKSLLGPSGMGLTCATFVLAVFESAGIRLLSYDQWPAREQDKAWRQHILDLLAKSGSDRTREHAAAIEKDDVAARFRPEEVTAAAGLYPPTAKFESAVETGRLLLSLS